MFKTLRIVLLVAVTCGGLSLAASTSAAQDGYYSSYRPYSYRSMARTGKYHGYWRDLGYGFSARGTRGYYLPQVNYYYGGGYAPAPYVDPHYHQPHYYPPQPRPYGYR